MSNRSRTKLRELAYIISRNVFLFTNGIIFAVVALLFVFGATQAAIFLGIVSVLNIFFGLAQDIRAWAALEKLQLMTAPRVLRIMGNGSEESILADEVQKGDRIKVAIGSQVPCDGLLYAAQNLEVNEGLITGESNSLPRSEGDRLLAGSIVTSGSGIVHAETVFHESRIAKMTEGIKRYAPKASPIQDAVALVVKYSGFVLLAASLFIIGRGIVVHETPVRVIMNIGAVTSMLVPQGLIFMVTLFFAYGAAHFFRHNVLLQEVNATEKLGRIKNLCMDKTGTLTENTLAVERMVVAPNIAKEDAERFAAAYAQGIGATSEIMRAIKNFLPVKYAGSITETLAFSSWRRYGAVCAEGAIVLAGPPDIFLSRVPQQEEVWLRSVVAEHAHQGKHILCFARADGSRAPHDLSTVKPALLGVFVFYNNLREGIRDTVAFFQDRGVRIRIISGDHPETVRAVAALSGINDAERLITGPEMESWSLKDFNEKVGQYTIFAQIVPEQKEKIVEAFKTDGFTAMVGDGANDALAVKKADLGIAMFDGASATRHVASVVLTNNSFSALPNGVRLADGIIKNIEVFASIFLNITFLGFFIFVSVSMLGYSYPLTPLNITLIDYFTIGIPGILISYWAIRPRGKTSPASTEPFLKRIVPFALSSALIQAIGITAIFVISPESAKTSGSNFFVIIGFIVLGFIFFACAPGAYRKTATRPEKAQILYLGMLEALLFLLILQTPFLLAFFNAIYIPLTQKELIWTMAILSFFGFAQYALAKRFGSGKYTARPAGTS